MQVNIRNGVHLFLYPIDMKKVKVKGYSYKRNGKTIMVKSHSRKCSGVKSSGEEFTRKKESEGLVSYDNWEEFQDAINEVGWENMTLTKGKRFKVSSDGKKTLHIKDPRGNDPENKYVGFRQGGKLVGAANVYVGKDYVELGDFEVFPGSKGKGYGRKFFNDLRKKYPNKKFTLLWGNKGAQKFWEKMGFKSVSGRVMEL